MRNTFVTAAFALLTSIVLPAEGWAQTNTAAAPSAAQRMSVPDEHERKLAARVGTWSVVSTLRLTPDAQPILQKGLIAQRRMIGLYMEEEMKPAPGSQTQDFHRLAYLTYSRVEGRWQYVSMDTRFPVGIAECHEH